MPTAEQCEARRRDGQAYINQLNEVYVKNCEGFDRAILTLSSSFLVLSMTFIDKVVPLSQAVWLCLLMSAWTLFITAIVINLSSVFISHREIKARRTLAEQFYFKFDERAGDQLRAMSSITERLNLASGAAYVLGTILLAVFTFTNLSQGDASMAKAPKTSKTRPAPQKISREGARTTRDTTITESEKKSAIPPPPPSDTTIVNRTKKK